MPTLHDDATVRQLLAQTGIQDVMNKDNITEIAVNQCGRIFWEGQRGWEFVDDPRCNHQQLQSLARAMAVYSQSGQKLDVTHPLCSVVLPDGERGQIVIPPATDAGNVSLTIRKPSLTRFDLQSYQDTGRFSDFTFCQQRSPDLTDDQKRLFMLAKQGNACAFFRLAVSLNLNILLVGGTGSGKTTLTKTLADLYPVDRRIFTIEDVHELDLPLHPNHLHLYYKAGGVSPQLMIESCMRMKPDHVFLAELRGPEALYYFELLNTGHSGSLTTTHANDCLSAFYRLADLIKQSPAGQQLDYNFILNLVRKSIDVVCFFKHGHMKELYYNPEMKNALMANAA